ncbi:MAG: C-terminal binding protein [Armatimonadota bacterium]|nr:C-terminal binding protein [bacterium]
MAKYKVAVTDYVFPNLEPEREILNELDVELIAGQAKSREEVIELVRGADAVLNCYYKPIDGVVMDAMPDCKIIVRYGIGFDSIDVPAATARGIMVANVPDYCVVEVSDQAVAMMLALLRKLSVADAGVRSGDWQLVRLKPMRRIDALTVGIIGMGRIGRAIALKAAVFGPKIVFFDPYQKDAGIDAQSVDLDTLYAESDAIIVQAPATAATEHLLDDRAFSMMTKKPIIVNCARGELIDTSALIRAFEDGRVSGAGLDVIEGTPPIPEDSPLLKFDNVILAPHSAWFSEEALVSLQRFAAMEVARALRGERVKSLVNPHVGGQN